MINHRLLLCILTTILVFALVFPAQAAPSPNKAGNISALLPVARVSRGTGRAAVTTEAKKGDELLWDDLVKTEKGGRARITLVDQSILSLGSQAELKIVKHDARSQQTALQLGYGRVRAEVTKVTRQGGSFELKTPTAVAGVIGTDFGTDASSVGTTTFVCISGIVQVANIDPGVAGSVQCAPGMTTTVSTGNPPTAPIKATPQQIEQLIEDTEPAVINAISPNSALPGTAVDATISGSKLANVKQVSIDGAGAKVTLVGTPTDSSVTVHIVLDAGAAAGPRTITLAGQSGTASAAVFTILSPATGPIPGATTATTETPPALQLPTPNVNNTERSIDVGAAFGDGTIVVLDASSSKAASGASIMNYNWVLCDPAYKPAQFGVTIAGNTGGCNPLSGYGSTNSDFAFPTCNLNPGDYVARLTVTDSNNQSAAMDVKVHVLTPTYDDPAARVRSLATAYGTLQVNQVLPFFDDNNFPGYTSLAENMRNTFPLLASMSINPRPSQANVNCNDATIRSDWPENYTFKQNPNVSFSDAEQISIRMRRTPGKGWLIVDFQGDNGTVQGKLPGPTVTDTSQPDMTVAAVYPSYATQGSTAALPVPSETQSFTAVISNIGSAALTAATSVRFQLLDSTGTAIGSYVDVPLPVPLNAGASETVTASLSVTGTPGTAFQISATVNPGCTTAEANCANNSSAQALVVGAVNFQLALAQPISPVQNVLVGGSAQIPITLTEAGGTFPIGIAAGPANGNLIYTIPSPSMPPGSQTVTVASSAAMAAGNFGLAITASSYGLTQSVTQPLNFVSAKIVPTNLFLNDASNPLEIQIGQTSLTMLPTVQLTLSSTYFSGSATVSAPPTTLGFNSTVDNGATTTVGPGGTFTWEITANYGASTTVIPLTVSAQLPNSNPPAVVNYTMYVKAVGVPDLQVLSVTPITRAPSTTAPWLSGEGIDFSVVVKNNGQVSSAGGERITMTLSSAAYEVEKGSPTPPVPVLAPGASATVTVHAVAPDVNSSFFDDPAMTLKTKIWADIAGDINYADNTLTASIPTANWTLAVSGAGADDTNYLSVVPGQTVTSAVTFAVDNSGSPGHSINAAAGAVTTGFLLPTFGRAGSATAVLSAATPSASVNVSTDPNLPPASGYQYVQVVAQMVDGGTVTAQRQATIHVVVTSAPGSQTVGVTLAPLDFTNSATPLQLNGPLAERFTVTPYMLGCPTCSGAPDLTFNDASNTATTPTQFKQAAFNTAQVATVAAALDPSGNVYVGAASGYAISVTGAPMIAVRRGATPSPSPVGPPIPLYANVGDLHLSMNVSPAGMCYNVVPGGPALSLTGTWNSRGGFNAPITWEIQNANHMPAGATPVSFAMSANAASSYPASWGASMSASVATDGLQEYFVAVTISNSIATATKYFPFYVDSSTSQNFCGAAMGARGFALSPVNGSWSRTAGGGGVSTSAVRPRTTTSTAGQPDLRLSASDVSFSPSLPKAGDTVQIRFRVRNEGSADAVGVPIALQINGSTVAIDKFDVPAGQTTLAGLTWNAARLPAGAPALHMTRPLGAKRYREAEVAPDATAAVAPAIRAMLLIDPQHTVVQKTALEKSARIAYFSLRNDAGSSPLGGPSSLPGQRILVELEDGACAGVRVATGSAGLCGSADAEITVADLAKSTLSLNTFDGIADLGAGFAPSGDAMHASGTRFASQTVGMAGHSYVVRLANGRPAVLTLVSVRNPGQLDARTRALFRANAIRIMRQLGSDSGPVEPGDLTGNGGPKATVFLELTVQTP